MGALLLGYYPPGTGTRGDTSGGLYYAGKVGTGFSDEERVRLAGLLEKRRTGESPFQGKVGGPTAVFARPELVAEVEFREWTSAGKLRQPSYKGLRSDKGPGQVVREREIER